MARTKYEADAGTIHTVNMSAKKIAVTGNTAPEASVNSDIIAKVSKSNRSYGLRPRGVVLTQTVTGGSGAAAVSRTKTAFLPILTKTIFDGATFAKESSVTYNGGTWTVLSKRGEDH
jgi:hypothetical protein